MPRKTNNKVKKSLWRLPVDCRGYLMFLGFCNLAFLFVRGWHLRSVDGAIESRIKRDVSHDLISRFDAWVSSVGSNSFGRVSNDSNVSTSGENLPFVQTDWQYSVAGRDCYVSVDGLRLKCGDLTEHGRILEIGPRIVRCSGAFCVLGSRVNKEIGDNYD